jgi:hypothetical protein
MTKAALSGGLRILQASRLLLERVAGGVLGFTDLLLDLANNLVGLAFGLQLLVASQPANSVLDGALGLFADACDFIFVHGSLLWFVCQDNGP